MKKVNIIRDREIKQHRYMKEEDHNYSTLLSLLSHTLLHKAAKLLLLAATPLSLSRVSLTLSNSLSHFALQVMPLFIGFDSSSSRSFVNNGGHSLSIVDAASFNNIQLSPTTHYCSL